MKDVQKSVLVPYEKYQRLLQSHKDKGLPAKAFQLPDQAGKQRGSTADSRYRPYQHPQGPPGLPARLEAKKRRKPTKKWIEV